MHIVNRHRITGPHCNTPTNLHRKNAPGYWNASLMNVTLPIKVRNHLKPAAKLSKSGNI